MLEQAEGFKHRIADTRLKLNQALERGETVLLEGSQGTLLDVDHGTYPYVTSSNPTSGGAAVGSGIGPNQITTVLGILKATPPASAPARSRPNCSTSSANTWPRTAARSVSPPAVRVAAAGSTRSSPATPPASTASPTTSSPSWTCCRGLDTVPICVAYEVDGERVRADAETQTDFHHAKPIYEEMPGWWEDISAARTFEELPENAQDYVLRLEELSGARISCIGVGPGRDETIVRHDVVR